MRHRWMVMLVVLVTTITTAQEALKQYDTLRAQAQGWATLRLWTGFINTYTPQDEMLEATEEVASCPASPAEDEHDLRQDAPAQAQSIEARMTGGQKHDAAGHVASVEASTPEPEHHADSQEATESAFEHTGEVAMLAETVAAMPVETDDRETEPAEPLDSSDDSAEEISALHSLREVRLAGRDRNQELEVIAPQAIEAASTDAALHRVRLASRAKARAMRRAIRVIQIQLDRAAKAELKTDRRISVVELPSVINTMQRTHESTGSIAALYPAAPQDESARQCAASMSGGE
ncbi:MAG TPA: hypothetical protein VIW80_19725 [Pyrinomonadaceae bacterium]